MNDQTIEIGLRKMPTNQQKYHSIVAHYTEMPSAVMGPNTILIINLPGHWICLYVSGEQSTVEYFDPQGNPMPLEIRDWISKHNMLIVVEHKQVQDYSKICGQLCL